MTALPALAPAEPESLRLMSLEAAAVIGGERDMHGLPCPVRASPTQVFAPRGLCVHPGDGSFWVSDTGHHRILGWDRVPLQGEPASRLLGQQSWAGDHRNAGNAGAAPHAAGLNTPTGIAPLGNGLVVADAWNHRVLIWHALPDDPGRPADVVLGQVDFSRCLPNRGVAAPGADTLHWPFGVLVDKDLLYVADTGNRRVLIWQGLPQHNGQPADVVLGQPDFDRRDENAGGPADAASMRWPHGLTLWQSRLCVADAGNNRVMVYAGTLPASGSQCEYVLGQPDALRISHHQGQLRPAAGSLNMPYSLAAAGDWLLVADTASSRLLGWHIDDLCDGAPARAVGGQPDFDAQGDNGWSEIADNSLSWPYALSVAMPWLLVADTGNSRVLIHRLWS